MRADLTFAPAGKACTPAPSSAGSSGKAPKVLGLTVRVRFKWLQSFAKVIQFAPRFSPKHQMCCTTPPL